MAGKFDTFYAAAERLYLDSGKTIKEIAALLPVSDTTIGDWCKDHEWVSRKKKQRTGPATIVRRLEEMIDNLLQQRGQSDAQTADALVKLDKTLQRYQKFSEEHFVDRAVEVMSRFTDMVVRVRPKVEQREDAMQLIEQFFQELEEGA